MCVLAKLKINGLSIYFKQQINKKTREQIKKSKSNPKKVEGGK